MFAFAEELSNPLEDSSVLDYLSSFFHGIIIAALPILIVLLIAVGAGFVLARGNTEQINSSKKLLVYSLLAVLGILGIGFIFSIFKNLLLNIYHIF